MPRLLEIADSINRYINMTVTVLDMTVDVVDINLIRVAAMGRFNQKIGERVRHGLIFSEVMREGKDILIEEPQNSGYCKDCSSLDFCGRFARLYTPITMDGQIIGAVCLHSNTAEQNDIVLKNLPQYHDFIHSLSDLISLKAKEHASQSLQRYNLNLQNRLINLIDEGVIIFDSSKHILFMNEKSEYTLGCTIGQLQYLEKHNMLSIHNDGKMAGNRAQYSIRVREKTIILKGSTYLIDDEEKNQFNIVFIFRNFDDGEAAIDRDVFQDLRIDELSGKSPAFVKMIEDCKKASYRCDPILLEGKNGTGKDQISRAIHNEGILKNGRFIVIGQDDSLQHILNTRSEIKESERQNNVPDTLLINEIVKLNWDDQNCLLYFISNYRSLNVQLICCTQFDFKEEMQKGNVSPDLYYALDIYRIKVPSLSERGGDLSLLTNELLKEANLKYGRSIVFSKDLLELMRNYSWPGNISELKNFIYHVVERSNPEDGRLTENEIPAFLLQKLKSGNMEYYSLEEHEKKLIVKALNELGSRGFSKREIAAALGIGSATLYRKMSEYAIETSSTYV